MWKGNFNAGHAPQCPQIKVIERASLDLHQDFVGARFGALHIGVFQLFDSAVFFKNNRAHFRHDSKVSKSASKSKRIFGVPLISRTAIIKKCRSIKPKRLKSSKKPLSS